MAETTKPTNDDPKRRGGAVGGAPALAEEAPAVDPAAATIDATDDGIALSGTVPSDTVADEPGAVAAALSSRFASP